MTPSSPPLTKKTLTVPRGLTYTYYTSPPATGSNKPTILLFHGWPDTALGLWSDLITSHLQPAGYGVLAPDCLGFGESSKPTDPEFYGWSLITSDAAAILDNEGIESCISMGHDWGCAVSQRFYNFFPGRVKGQISVNIAYSPPRGEFDLEETNALTKKFFNPDGKKGGGGKFEYWEFFGGDSEAAELMDRNPESVYDVAHVDPPEKWLDTFCTKGGMREFIAGGKRCDKWRSYAGGKHREDFLERLGGGGGGGFAAPLCLYQTMVKGIQNGEEKKVAKEDWVLRVPHLLWGCERDMVCRHELHEVAVQEGLLTDATKIVRDGGHWGLLEMPDVFGQDIVGWLEQKF